MRSEVIAALLHPAISLWPCPSTCIHFSLMFAISLPQGPIPWQELILRRLGVDRLPGLACILECSMAYIRRSRPQTYSPHWYSALSDGQVPVHRRSSHAHSGDTADAHAANGQAISIPASVLRTAQGISTAPPLACRPKPSPPFAPAARGSAWSNFDDTALILRRNLRKRII